MEHTTLVPEEIQWNDNTSEFPNANLSDIIEVIETDPDFRDVLLKDKMFNGGGEISSTQQPSSSISAQQIRRQAKVRIVEQPASKALRFRYECEGRSAGSIPGASSTSENKTFPTIQIVGYQGKAVVVVSCVTKDPPYKPHPHNLVGREGCKKGVCTLEISPETMTVQFSNLGIQCVKKKDIEQALKVREEIRVDPFRTGFGHRNQPTTIDLNVVRLCFQVFLESGIPGKKYSVSLTPVVSDPIYDKKAMADLSIYKMSHCTSYVDGGKNDIILLCEKVAKEDIQVRFYEENGDWEAFADFQPTQVYKQHAIWFKTPKYKNVEVTDPVKVLIQLRRPSDGATSESLPFELLPVESEPGAHRRKRPKIDNPGQMLRHLQDHEKREQVASGFQMDAIKIEPRDTSPSPYQGSLSPYHGLTPQYVPNLSTSPNYQFQLNVTGNTQYNVNTPTFANTSSQQQAWSNQINLLQPEMNIIESNVPPQWTVTLPGPSAVMAGKSTTTNNIGEYLLYDLEAKQVNSEEIERIMTKEDPQLHELSVDDFSFSDINVPSQDNNMTDSIERFAKFTIDNMTTNNN